MSQKRNVRALNNESPAFRRLGAGGHLGLGDILDSLLTSASTGLLSSAGLAIGTSSKAKVKTTNPVYYISAGSLKLYASGTEIAFTATTHDVTGHATLDKEAIYAISLDTNGAGVITKGPTVTSPNAAAPATPAGNVLLGYVKIKVTAGGGSPFFDATTDELDEAHITDTYTDTTPGALAGAGVAQLV